MKTKKDKDKKMKSYLTFNYNWSNKKNKFYNTGRVSLKKNLIQLRTGNKHFYEVWPKDPSFYFEHSIAGFSHIL